MAFREWLLSRQCQLTLQLSCSLLITSLFTLWRPLFFPHACLTPVFVIVIVGSLAQDQHIGTRLQVSAWVLGPTWLAAVLAGGLMTLAKLVGTDQPHGSSGGGYVAATAVLGLLGLALLVFLQTVAPPGPGRVMGIIAVLMYGIMVTLSVLYPTLSSMWVGAVLLVALGMFVAAVVGILVGWLVLPSLASDEVWRLTSEALQGAGAVLSYHSSLLMVDEQPGEPLHSKESQSSHAAIAQMANHVGAAARSKAVLSPVHPAPQHKGGHHQQQQQQQEHEWGLHRRQQSRHLRSSIEIAAAGAAVVAASQGAHKPAAEAAAVALSWMDAADSAVSTAASGDAAAARDASDAWSQHSSGYGTISCVGSDAIADAAAEFSKRSVLQQQQQHGMLDPPLRGPRLSEQLLQEQQQQQQQQEEEGTGSPGRNIVDAWVSAAAAVVSVTASRRGIALPHPAPVSEDGSSMTDGLSSGVHQGQRKSLEGAASLDFMEEMDDTAFIQMMRALSQSKGSAGTKPPAAAAEKGAKPSNSTTQLMGPSAAAGTKQKGTMPQSKSVGSALSALSVAGSSTAPADWARAVSPRRQRHQGAQDAPAEADGLQDGPPTVAGAALAATSVAASVISSHGSILQQAAPQMPQLLPRKQQHSRFAAGQKILLAHTQQPHTAGVGKRRSLGSRAWSFLTQRSWSSAAAGGRPPATQSSCSSHGLAAAEEHTQQSSDSSSEGPLAWQGAAAAPRQLRPPTTSAELQPLIGRAKAALASARLEPWWLRPNGMQQLNVEACMQLLDDTELLLVRLSTLEGVSEERSLMGLQLHQLAHYKGIADALALIFAQLTAFIIDVASAVAKQETCHCETPPWRLSWPRGKAANGVPSNTRQPPQSSSMKRPGGAAAAVTSQPAVQRPSPFAAAAGAAGAGGVDADAASVGMSALLSGMERQGSMVSSYLWEKKTGWKTARALLKREMDASLGSYWWSVRKASKSLPVKVPRSREVMILIFLWPICNGVLDACERMELSARQVLHPHTAKAHPTPPANTADAAKAAAAAGAGASTAAGRPALFTPLRWLFSAFPRAFGAASHSAHANHKAEQPVTVKAATGSDTGQPGPAFSMQRSARRAGAALWHWSGLRAVWGWLEWQRHWAGPLLQLVLVKPALLAVVKAVTHDVSATLSSKQGIKAMLASRTFQAAMKLLLTTGSILLMTILLMHYIPAVAHSVPIFGYAAAVLCCQARVEATVDQAARRVIGTILGACLGLATNSIPNIFQEPFLLSACLAVASLVLGVLARPQRRTAIVLALLTLCAVSLCAYEAACCSAKGSLGPVEQFLARMASVVGACIWVALVNRLLLPWYTSDYALEQLADALEQAALLFMQIYDSQLERMRLAELVAGQTQHEAPEALLVHDGAGPAAPTIDARSADSGADGKVQLDAPPAVQLAAREAAEAQLLVVLRQQVLGRLVAVQLSLAKESVSWRRGVLATPPLVLNVLGALNAIKEALTSQRLALAPFTRHGAASLGAEQPGPMAASGTGSGMLHTMVHCYSLWALPLHPLWLEILRDVHELTAATAAVLRHPPHGAAARSTARTTLLGKLGQLEQQRLELRHGWLDIRVKLHRAVHGGQSWVPTATEGSSFWPTDSVHLFTFTYGVSRCLNAFAAAAQAVANNLED